MSMELPSRWLVAASAATAIASAMCAVAVAGPLFDPAPAPRPRTSAPAPAPRTVVQIPVLVATPPPRPARCEMHADLRFAYNATSPPEDTALVLASVLEHARTHADATIQIDGHADASGNSYQNLLLSKARAHNVALRISAAGVTNRIVERAFGEFVPADASSLADQRRVRVTLREPNCTSEEQP